MKWKTKTLQNLPLFAINNYMFFLVLKFKKAEMVNCFWNIYIFYRNPSFKCLCNIVPVQKNYIWSLLLFFFWCSENLVYINQYVKNETKFLWPMILFHIYKLMPVTYCKFVVAPGPFTIIFHLRFNYNEIQLQYTVMYIAQQFYTHIYSCSWIYLAPYFVNFISFFFWW